MKDDKEKYIRPAIEFFRRGIEVCPIDDLRTLLAEWENNYQLAKNEQLKWSSIAPSSVIRKLIAESQYDPAVEIQESVAFKEAMLHIIQTELKRRLAS